MYIKKVAIIEIYFSTNRVIFYCSHGSKCDERNRNREKEGNFAERDIGCGWPVASSSRSGNKRTGDGNNKQTNQCGHIAVSDRIFSLLCWPVAGGERGEVYGR